MGLQLDENTLYRSVSDELVVIQLETGEFFYFNSPTERLLETLRTPKKYPESPELRGFCEFLVKNRICKEVPDEGFEFQSPPEDLPTFLRKGTQTLDQMTFLCP